MIEAAQDRIIVGIAHSAASVDDDISRWQVMLVPAERFTDQTLDEIAAYSVAHHSGRHGQSEACMSQGVGTSKHGEQGICRAARSGVDAVELALLLETLRRCEATGCLRLEGRGVAPWKRYR